MKIKVLLQLLFLQQNIYIYKNMITNSGFHFKSFTIMAYHNTETDPVGNL